MEWEKHCWAEVDLGAIRRNFRRVKQASGGGAVMAVVKADAYGHGDAAVAQALSKEGADAFAVSCLAEALRLRRAGVAQPVLILGHTQPQSAAALAANKLWQTVHTAEYARALSEAAAAQNARVECHLKLDTGMGRLGFCVRNDDQLAASTEEISACFSLPGLTFVGAFCHFAAADSTDAEDVAYTEIQRALFEKAVAALEDRGARFRYLHCCNSAAAFLHPDWHGAFVRPGIVLYGHQPSGEAALPGLEPALQLKAVVAQVKELSPGESVSYGRTFTAPAPLRVATLAVGYADGYPRLLSGRGTVGVRGLPARVLGRVCMDQMLVDVSGIEGVKRGDEAVVLGGGGADSFETAAALCGTIPYELLCGLSRRVPRYYRDGGQAFRVDYLE